MRIIRKILFSLISIFLLYKAIELLRKLIITNPDIIDFQQYIIVSFLLTLYTTGFYAFIGFAYPTSRLISTKYYVVKNEKGLKVLYSSLGIKAYRKLLLVIFWGREKNRLKYFDGSREGIHNFIFQTKQSEFGHMTAFITLFIISIILALYGHVTSLAIILVLNIIGNLYPSILQRYHRLRLKRVTMHPRFSV